jgi:hypothetical protein
MQFDKIRKIDRRAIMQQPSFPPPQGQQSPYQQPINYSPYYGQPGYMPVQQVARSKGTFKYGLIFGGILALLSLGIELLSLTPVAGLISTSNPWLGTLIWALLQGVLAWIIYGVAGLVVARRTASVRSGVFACLWALLWYLLVDVLLIVPFWIIADLQYGVPANQILPLLLSGQSLLLIAESIVLDAFLALTFGIGIGAIGAVIGKSLAPKTPY